MEGRRGSSSRLARSLETAPVEGALPGGAPSPRHVALEGGPGGHVGQNICFPVQVTKSLHAFIASQQVPSKWVFSQEMALLAPSDGCVFFTLRGFSALQGISPRGYRERYP